MINIKILILVIKNEERVCLKRINSKVEEIKIELSNIFESSFLIENL